MVSLTSIVQSEKELIRLTVNLIDEQNLKTTFLYETYYALYELRASRSKTYKIRQLIPSKDYITPQKNKIKFQRAEIVHLISHYVPLEILTMGRLGNVS